MQSSTRDPFQNSTATAWFRAFSSASSPGTQKLPILYNNLVFCCQNDQLVSSFLSMFPSPYLCCWGLSSLPIRFSCIVLLSFPRLFSCLHGHHRHLHPFLSDFSFPLVLCFLFFFFLFVNISALPLLLLPFLPSFPLLILFSSSRFPVLFFLFLLLFCFSSLFFVVLIPSPQPPPLFPLSSSSPSSCFPVVLSLSYLSSVILPLGQTNKETTNLVVFQPSLFSFFQRSPFLRLFSLS